MKELLLDFWKISVSMTFSDKAPDSYGDLVETEKRG